MLDGNALMKASVLEFEIGGGIVERIEMTPNSNNIVVFSSNLPELFSYVMEYGELRGNDGDRVRVKFPGALGESFAGVAVGYNHVITFDSEEKMGQFMRDNPGVDIAKSLRALRNAGFSEKILGVFEYYLEELTS